MLSWLALLLVGTTLLGSLWHLHRTGQLLYPGRCASASDDPARSGAEAEADANPNLSKLGMPVIFDELAAAPPLDTWRTPVVSLERGGTALMFLHIFSSISPEARAKRELIRDLTILQHVNERYRHLIDIKFVIGYPDPEKMALAENEGEMTEENGQGQDREDGEREPPFDRQAVLLEEAAIEREMRRYGDVIRLEGLLHGENMNEGKSWEWIRWVGNHSPREAQWVFKCDDDVSGVPDSSAYIAVARGVLFCGRDAERSVADADGDVGAQLTSRHYRSCPLFSRCSCPSTPRSRHSSGPPWASGTGSTTTSRACCTG